MNMAYFNVEKTREELVNWIKNWFNENGNNCKAIIGISGGADSTIVSALCVRALGKDRVLGVLMPNGEQKDISDSHRVCDALGIENIVVNISEAYKNIEWSIVDGFYGNNGNRVDLSEQARINLAPRLRMTTLYAVSQTVGGRVVNTSNKSEYMTGYWTKAGDSVGDLKPLINLTKSEVVEIGKTLTEIPIDLIVKPPADGLTGTTDEDKIGFSYDDLDKFIRGFHDEINEDTCYKILNRINTTAFKRNPIAAFVP